MPCGFFKPTIASLFHELHGVLQMHDNVCRLIQYSSPQRSQLAASPPKTTLSASSPNRLWLPPPTTLTGYPSPNSHRLSAITPTLALHVIIPTVAVPFQKTYPCFRHSILELSLAFSAQSFRTDRRLWTAPSACAVSATKP